MNVDFYVMEGANRMQALQQLCLQLEAPYAAGDQIYIYASSANEAVQLDDLLWTYRDESFLAHQLADANHTTSARIVIGTEPPSLAQQTVLVNLSAAIPAFFQQFNRIIEIVFDDPSLQQAARDRFRQYREKGCQLNTHKLKVKTA